MAQPTEHWHLDKRVPIAFILAIVMQTIGAVYWAGVQSERVDAIETQVNRTVLRGERIKAVEVEIKGVRHSLVRIENTLLRAFGRSDK